MLSNCRAQPVLWKNSASERNDSLLSNCRAQPVLWKNSASERNDSLLSNCRAQPVLFKNSASERNESLLSDCRAQPVLLKKTEKHTACTQVVPAHQPNPKPVSPPPFSKSMGSELPSWLPSPAPMPPTASPPGTSSLPFLGFSGPEPARMAGIPTASNTVISGR